MNTFGSIAILLAGAVISSLLSKYPSPLAPIFQAGATKLAESGVSQLVDGLSDGSIQLTPKVVFENNVSDNNSPNKSETIVRTISAVSRDGITYTCNISPTGNVVGRCIRDDTADEPVVTSQDEKTESLDTNSATPKTSKEDFATIRRLGEKFMQEQTLEANNVSKIEPDTCLAKLDGGTVGDCNLGVQ